MKAPEEAVSGLESEKHHYWPEMRPDNIFPLTLDQFTL